MPAQPTVGLIMPHSTNLVPVEAQEVYPDIRFVSRGVGVTSLTPAGYDAGVDKIVPAAVELAEEGANAIMVFGTSLSFYRGAAFNAELVERIEAKTGLPASTMSSAVVEAMAAVGAHKVAVCTAYADEVNGRLRQFLTASGLEVLSLRGFGIERFGSARTVSEDNITHLAREALDDAPEAEGLLISCGGLRTLHLAEPLEAERQVPVVSSTPAALWKCAKLVGHSGFAARFGRLFELSMSIQAA